MADSSVHSVGIPTQRKRWSHSRQERALAWLLILPGFLYNTPCRFDILPALLVMASILAADRRRIAVAGLCLGLAERVGPDHVELHVVSIHLEVGPYQAVQAVDAGVARQQLWREFHIEQRAARFDVVHLRSRPQHGCGAVAVRALDRADAF